MQNKWLHCFVAVISTVSTACQKDPAPAPTETVTQSAKPAPAETAKPEATTATAQPSAAAPAAQPGTEGQAPAQPAGEATAAQLAIGSDAPNVTFTLQDGKTVALSSLKGKQVAVYFYPKDDTPGCTVEAQGIRDQWEAFEKAGIEVYGVSTQDAASHTAFIEKHKLPFDLVVDSDGSIAQAFGVPLSGKQFAARQTFLIGADGKIKQVWRSVTPAEHAQQLLEAAGATPASPAAPKAG